MANSERVAFVAGATGYTGREVVRLVGERAIAHVRRDSSRLAQWRDRFAGMDARVDTTAWSLEDMTATLRSAEPATVYALLGTTRSRAKGEGRSADAAYEAVDYGLTALLIQAAVASGHRPRFVYLSAAGLSENTRNPYMRARVRAEADLTASGLPYTIVRPSFITGDREQTRPGERAAAAVADGLLAIAGAFGARRLRDRYRSQTATELASTLIRLADDPAWENKIVHGDDVRE